MPTIKQSELNAEIPPTCVRCGEYEASIWLCGEGYLCEACMEDSVNTSGSVDTDHPG